MYKIWSEESIRSIKGDSKSPKVVIDGIMDIINIANEKHNAAMSEKDIEIAELKGYIRGLEKS